MEDGGFRYYGMGTETFGAEEEQGSDQIWDGSLDGHLPALASVDIEQNQAELPMEEPNLDPISFGWGAAVPENYQLDDAHLSARDWGGNPMELETSTEAVHAQAELTSCSMLPSSTSATDDTSPSTNNSPAVQSEWGSSHKDAPSDSALNNTRADEWSCDFYNCGKSFTHRHKLNRHRMYHVKPYRCLESSCINAYSLKKDLARHQAKHNGLRFYCNEVGCSYAIGGTEGGFTRKDNLKRHIKNRHQYA